MVAKTNAQRQADLRFRRTMQKQRKLDCWISAKAYEALEQWAEREGLTLGEAIEVQLAPLVKHVSP